MDIIGLIPAAGKGTRLGWPTAKELLPITKNNTIQPLIHNIIDYMSVITNDLVVVTRYDKPEIMKYISQNVLSLNVSYVCQRENKGVGKSSGLIEAIDSAYHLTKNKIVLFGMPDTYISSDRSIYSNLIESVAYDVNISLGIFKTDTPQKFGMVDFDSNTFQVHKVVEKPPTSDLQYMWGILVWDDLFTEHIHTCVLKGIYEYDVILNSAIEHNFIANSFIIEGTYNDLGTKEDASRIIQGR